MGKYTIISEEPSIHGVYLPYSFNAGDFYHIGDDFTVTDNTSTETVRVAGFYYSTMTSSQNCYMITLIFDDDVFEHVSHTFADSGLMVSVRGKDPAVSKTLDREFPGEIKQSPISRYFFIQTEIL